MTRRKYALPQTRPQNRPDIQHHRELTRLLARLVATRWRQMHASPRASGAQPRKGFSRHK